MWEHHAEQAEIQEKITMCKKRISAAEREKDIASLGESLPDIVVEYLAKCGATTADLVDKMREMSSQLDRLNRENEMHRGELNQRGKGQAARKRERGKRQGERPTVWLAGMEARCCSGLEASCTRPGYCTIAVIRQMRLSAHET